MKAFAVKAPAVRPKVERHSAFAGEAAASKERQPRQGPLVIPLVSPPRPPTEGEPRAFVAAAAQQSLEERAAAAVIAEASGTRAEEKDGGLVIGMEAAAPAKGRPLLAAAQLPGLSEIEDEGEKFRMDVSMRAEDVPATSEAYERVRVEEFGAAVLRGMGWRGESDEARRFDVAPRQQRLGLGAQPKPKELFDKKGKLRVESKRPWLGATRDEAERLKKSRRGVVVVGDVADDGRSRCRVLELRGETEALVELESTGKRLVKPVADLDRVSTQRLLARPFEVAARPAAAPTPATRSTRPAKRRENWLAPGIRVRITKEGDPLYRHKARVLDVIRHDGLLRALLHLDNGRLLHEPGLKEKHLETALPKEGGRLRAVAGPHKGRLGVLVRRDKAAQSVLLRFDDDADFLHVPMDDVAEFCGDEDDPH